MSSSAEQQLNDLLHVLEPYKNFISSGLGLPPPPLQYGGITFTDCPTTPDHTRPLSPPPQSSRRHRRKPQIEDDDFSGGILSDEETSSKSKPTKSTYNLYTQPKCIKNGTLRTYQLEGVSWLARLHKCGLYGILADEMGLGKTIQTISFLGYLKEQFAVKGPHLIVVPKSTLPNWLREFAHWFPSCKAEGILGTKEERDEKIGELFSGNSITVDVIVTTYEVAVIEKSSFKKIDWYTIVVDEGHRLKNHQSKLAETLRTFNSLNRLLLTGTPLQNNLKELWSLLNFLRPDLFSNSDIFESWFSLIGGQNSQNQSENQSDDEKIDSNPDDKSQPSPTPSESSNPPGSSIDSETLTSTMSVLHSILKPFVLRRVKSEVEDLPPKSETIVHIKLTTLQKAIYKSIITKELSDILYAHDSDQKSKIGLLNVVMQLRKVCNHPYLFEGIEPGPPFIEGEHLIQSAGKLMVLDRLLTRLEEENSKVLIFSQMTSILDILEDFCNLRGIKFRRLDGSTDSKLRQDAVQEFQRDGSDVFVFLLSTRAGGLGINLTAADTVIIYDSDWNPQSDLQAIDRAHRIGQKRPVRVFRFVSEGTIEEKILERAMYKLQLDALVIQHGRISEKFKTVDRKELLSMVKFGADRIFSQTSDGFSEADIDALLDASIAKTEEITAKIKNNCQKTLQNIDLSLENSTISYSEVAGEEQIDQDTIINEIKALTGAENLKMERREKRSDQNLTIKTSSFVATVRHDFQFFSPEFIELDNKRNAKLKYYHDLNAGLITVDVESAPIFVDEEEQIWQELYNQGFPHWSRTDFMKFVKALEKYGHTAEYLTEIASNIPSKTLEEVEIYYQIFWKKFTTLSDALRIQKSINKSIEKKEKGELFSHLLSNKIAQSGWNWDASQLIASYSSSSKSKFSEEEDRLLVCAMAQKGYGNWTEITSLLRERPEVRFSWFLKSRPVSEISRRGEVLLRQLEKMNTGSRKRSSHYVSIVDDPDVKRVRTEEEVKKSGKK
ncbi:hypothetical protein RCL1_001559 [Eukaryota sp. TZLM3-RCL]